MKIKLAVATILSIIGIIMYSNNTNALEYSSSAGVNFTISPSISVSVSGDLIIDELAPGSQSDSNIVTVNVSTNNVSGYNLSSTVGNNTDTSTVDNSLIHNTTNLVNDTVHSNVFTSLSTSDKLSTLTTPNTWGYSYSTDDSTSWSNYSGLPLYTNTGITLSEKYVPSNDDIGFKIAAYADNTQASGEYTNKINFIAIAFPNPMSLAESYAYFNKTMYKGYYTIQDMTPGICATTDEGSELQVIDVRDEEVYLIGKLKDGRCWMKDNLRLGEDEPITLTNQDTNIINDYVLPSSGADCFTQLSCTGTDGTTGTGYTVAAINSNYKNETKTNYGSGSGKIGVYYNYCAVSAGTYCYDASSGTGNAKYDVCPLNWHLPTMTARGGSGNYNILYESYETISDIFAAFSVTLSGRYDTTGQVGLNSQQRLWASSFNSFDAMYNMYNMVSDYALGVNYRSNGFSARCIANNS